jgi:hypothetical protein
MKQFASMPRRIEALITPEGAIDEEEIFAETRVSHHGMSEQRHSPAPLPLQHHPTHTRSRATSLNRSRSEADKIPPRSESNPALRPGVWYRGALCPIPHGAHAADRSCARPRCGKDAARIWKFRDFNPRKSIPPHSSRRSRRPKGPSRTCGTVWIGFTGCAR